MPGIERTRYVTKEDNTLDDMICGICRGVVDDPVVTHCCLSLFCRECIGCWLKIQKKCPLDRKPMTAKNLIPVPRMTTNRLKGLNVKCEHYTKGCPVVISRDKLESHQKECVFSSLVSTNVKVEKELSIRQKINLSIGREVSDSPINSLLKEVVSQLTKQSIPLAEEFAPIVRKKYGFIPVVISDEKPLRLWNQMTYSSLNTIQSITERKGYENLSFEEIRHFWYGLNQMVYKLDDKEYETEDEEYPESSALVKHIKVKHQSFTSGISYEELRLYHYIQCFKCPINFIYSTSIPL